VHAINKRQSGNATNPKLENGESNESKTKAGHNDSGDQDDKHSEEEEEDSKPGKGTSNLVDSYVVSQYITLPPLPARLRPLKVLSVAEQAELECLFGIDKGSKQWNDDWVGVLALAEEDVTNPDAQAGERSKHKPLATWGAFGG
jgi:hypothetical protein